MTESIIERVFLKEIVEKAQKDLGVTFSDFDSNAKLYVFKFIRLCLLKAKFVLISEHNEALKSILTPLELLKENPKSLEVADKLLCQIKALKKVSETFLEEVKQEESRPQPSFDNSIPLYEDDCFFKLLLAEVSKIESLEEEFEKHEEIGDESFLSLSLDFMELAFSIREGSSEGNEIFEKKIEEILLEEVFLFENMLQAISKINTLSDVLLE